MPEAPTKPEPLQAAALLLAAFHALRSYEYGNSSTELAKDAADAIAAHLAKPDNRR